MIKFFVPVLCVAGLFLAGCAPTEAPKPAETGAMSAGVMKPNKANMQEAGALPEGMTAFKNKDGKVWCPLMNDEIPDPAKAVGFVDHENVRYYMCCPACLKQFKGDPAKFAAQAQADLKSGKI